MGLKTFSKLNKLVEYGNTLLSNIDVVSFDLFDTLLIRRIHDPDMIKQGVAQRIVGLAADFGTYLDTQAVLDCRQKHETHSRQTQLDKRRDAEARYPDFMREMLAELLGGDVENIYQQVRDYELALENAMLVPREELIAWLHSLHQQGKRILLISDIYLTRFELKPLLKHAGILDYFEQVISSADAGISKASGKAFAQISKHYQLKPNAWLHVGDHPLSDGIRPAQAGLQALVINDTEERRRIAIARRYHDYGQQTPFWKGRALQQFMAPLEAENASRSEQYVSGYNFFGPLFCLFIQRIAEYCLHHHIHKIFFCAREGWMFKQVWELVIPWLYPESRMPEIEYLYVSRRALAGARCGLDGLSITLVNGVLNSPGCNDIAAVCKAFNLDIDALRPLLQAHQLDADSVLKPGCSGHREGSFERFKQLLAEPEFQIEVKRQTRPQNQALQNYLQQAGYFAQPEVALVDIGWLGTIQRYLDEALSRQPERPTCHGLLFAATTKHHTAQQDDKSHLRGLLYDINQTKPAASSILYAQDMFEEACRAPHASLSAYRLDEKNGYMLEFKPPTDFADRDEKEQSRHYAELQRGILDAAGRYGPAISVMAADADDIQPWADYLLMSKLAFPKIREVRALRFKHHIEDFLGQSKDRNNTRRGSFPGNPWLLQGWRQALNTPFLGTLFSRHLKNLRIASEAEAVKS